MVKPDRSVKVMLFICTVALCGLLLRSVGLEGRTVADLSRNKQYAWGLQNQNRQSGSYWIGTSDDLEGHDGLGYQLDLNEVATLVAAGSRKGWTVHSIVTLNRGYSVLFEK